VQETTLADIKAKRVVLRWDGETQPARFQGDGTWFGADVEGGWDGSG